MKFLSVPLIVFLFAFLTSEGQVKPSNYSLSQRRSKFPFSASTKVRIGSFWIKEHQEAGNEMSIPKKSQTNEVDIERFEEILILTRQQVDTLSDILYNTYNRVADQRLSLMRCYEPRNAILFYDRNDTLIAYIEICFECYRLRTSSEKVFLEKMCDKTYRGIQDFFLKHGIKTSIYDIPD